jgi:hypothetical protein
LDDLKSTLEGLAHHLFGDDIDCRWNADTFPFTDPSLELEVRYENEWLEVLGCGVMKPSIVAQEKLQKYYHYLDSKRKAEQQYGLGRGGDGAVFGDEEDQLTDGEDESSS